MNKYIPNEIPLKTRIKNIIFSLFLIIYGGYGIYINELYLPARNGAVYLYGDSILIMYGAFICGALVMISVVVDHYDKRNNEKKYKVFSDFVKFLGWIFFIGALVYDLSK